MVLSKVVAADILLGNGFGG